MSSPAVQPIDIFTDTDFYVPAFEVRLNGQKQGGDVVRDVLQVSYRDNLEEIDSFELTVNNWDADRNTFKYSDGDTFVPGAKVELRMGYLGKSALRLMLRGEITSLRPQFPASGQPTLAVSGLNVLHRFRREKESHTYKDKTDTAIAREIAGRLQIDLLPNPAEDQEEKNEFLFQFQQYDILFLLQRARSLGYELVVVEDEQANKSKLYFGPSDAVKRVSYKLAYGKSLIQFQPTLTTAKQVNQVVVRG
jgi:phage protein D